MFELEDKNEFLIEFSKTLKDLRLKRKKVVKEISACSKVSQATIYRIEGNKRHAKADTAYKILKCLDIDLLKILEDMIDK